MDVHGLSIAMLNNQRVLPEKLQWMEWIEEILHQLIGGLSHRVSTIQGGAGFLPSTVGLAELSQVQIMACTADEDAVGYLNAIDERFRSAGWLRGRPGGENPWHRANLTRWGAQDSKKL